MDGNPSHLGAAVRLAVSGVRRRRRVAGSPAEPGRKLAVERRDVRAEPARVERYLAATRGTDVHPLSGGDAEVPPTYTAVWETALSLELLANDSLPFPSGGVVHLSSEVVALRPIHLSDRVRCRLELTRLEAHSRGAVLVLGMRCWNAAGQLCQQNESRLLLPGAPAPRGAGRPPRGDATAREGGELDWQSMGDWSLPADAGVRYARASGDFNPIHLWPWSSRLLGFPRPVLHGHCVVAMIAHDLSRATGRTTRKVSARFRAPLQLPARVRLEAAQGGEAGYMAVRLMEEADGAERRLVEGSWVGSEPATQG